MKNVAKTIAFVLISWVGGNANLWAQGSSSSGGSMSVAVIDIGAVFKSHNGFKQQMDGMKADVEAFGKQVNEERKALIKMRDRLQTYTPGSPEFKKAEEELARQASDQEVRGKLKQKDVLEQEAKIYYETYREVVREVQKVADSYGINLVLKFEADPIDGRDRNSVMAGVNRPIIYQRNLDLTQAVITKCNGSAPPPSQNAANLGTATRPVNTGNGGTPPLRPR